MMVIEKFHAYTCVHSDQKYDFRALNKFYEMIEVHIKLELKLGHHYTWLNILSATTQKKRTN